MRYLVLSDIHSNLEALEAVLRASAAQHYDAVLVLGDLVGYGADPNAVVDRVRGLNPAAIVRGNHDKVAAGLDDAEDFNPMAKSAAHWTRESLTPQTLEYLRDLPTGPLIVDDMIEICHGSPLDEDLYVVADIDAARSIAVGADADLSVRSHARRGQRADGCPALPATSTRRKDTPSSPPPSVPNRNI